MNTSHTITIASVDEMKALGADIAQTGITHILLQGDLGAGKTAFVTGYVQALAQEAEGGSDQTIVSSPTYAYINSYADDEGTMQIAHLDMYRLTDRLDLINLGLLDQIDTHDHVLIERPKRPELYDHHDRVTITITKTGEQTREVEVITKMTDDEREMTDDE